VSYDAVREEWGQVKCSHKETTARDPTSFAVGNSQRNRKIFGPAQLSSVRQIGTELLTGTAQFDVAAAAILP